MEIGGQLLSSNLAKIESQNLIQDVLDSLLLFLDEDILGHHAKRDREYFLGAKRFYSLDSFGYGP